MPRQGRRNVRREIPQRQPPTRRNRPLRRQPPACDAHGRGLRGAFEQIFQALAELPRRQTLFPAPSFLSRLLNQRGGRRPDLRRLRHGCACSPCGLVARAADRLRRPRPRPSRRLFEDKRKKRQFRRRPPTHVGEMASENGENDRRVRMHPGERVSHSFQRGAVRSPIPCASSVTASVFKLTFSRAACSARRRCRLLGVRSSHLPE